MFLNARSIAVDGIGFGHRLLAVLGFGLFDVQIDVSPYDGGDTEILPKRKSTVLTDQELFDIKIVVALKSGKRYETHKIYTKEQLNRLERVVAKLKKISVYSEKIYSQKREKYTIFSCVLVHFVFSNVKTYIKSVAVKAFKK